MDTWKELRTRSEALLKVLDERDRDLFRAQKDVADALKNTAPTISAIPRTHGYRILRSTRSSAEKLLKMLEAAASGPAYGTSSSSSRPAGDVILSLPAQDYTALRLELRAYLQGSGALMTNTEAALKATGDLRESVASTNSAMRNFVLSVWSLNAQRMRAYPPFFSQLGPLSPGLYGWGRTDPSAPPTTTTTTTTTTSTDTAS